MPNVKDPESLRYAGFRPTHINARFKTLIPKIAEALDGQNSSAIELGLLILFHNLDLLVALDDGADLEAIAQKFRYQQ